MTLYKQLKKIEKEYNMYIIDREVAQNRAKGLIEAFNKRSIEIAEKYNVKPTKLSMSKFSFGR